MTMAITDFNFDTKNIIIFHYPRYGGGKFVQNCLGLSDNVVFQKQSFAQAQIDGTFSFEDKKEYILKLIQKEDMTDKGWKDLDLGCHQLFVSDYIPFKSQTRNPMSYLFKGKQHSRISDTVKFLSSDENDKLLFSITHHGSYLNRKMFPNAKIVTFKNNSKMTKHRFSLPDRIIDAGVIDERHHWDEGNIDGREPDFTWNSEWFDNVTTTVDGLNELYKLFNLSDWQRVEPFIKEYYHIWCEKNHLKVLIDDISSVK